MNKNDLVERLAEEHELTKTFARDLVDSVFDMIATAAQRERRSHSSASAGSGWLSAPPARGAIPVPASP